MNDIATSKKTERGGRTPLQVAASLWLDHLREVLSPRVAGRVRQALATQVQQHGPELTTRWAVAMAAAAKAGEGRDPAALLCTRLCEDSPTQWLEREDAERAAQRKRGRVKAVQETATRDWKDQRMRGIVVELSAHIEQRHRPPKTPPMTRGKLSTEEWCNTWNAYRPLRAAFDERHGAAIEEEAQRFVSLAQDELGSVRPAEIVARARELYDASR